MDIVGKYFDEIVKTASEMIQISSKSGFEQEMAEYTIKKMKELGYDVTVDRAGSVIGKMSGTGGGKSVMLNCHLDTVDEGPHNKWKYPPFGGTIAEGAIWGRGASDTKGTFAMFLYAPYMLKKEGLLPKGDTYVVGVVHEESSGFGSMTMVQDGFKTDYAIVGEATENDIAVSCRGRIGVEVTITGKSCHASIPQTGSNPFDFLGEFLVKLKNFELGTDPIHGTSTISATKITSSEMGTNTIPNTIVLSLDYRAIPSDNRETVIAKLRKIADGITVPGVKVDIEPIMVPITCYNGFQGSGYQGEPAFGISKEHELVVKAKAALESAFERPVALKNWAFATDSGHFMDSGTAVVGFSPAEIIRCHTVVDNINIEMLRTGTVGSLALLDELCNGKEV
jgi:putative selenium metabolism hydrolase